MDQSGQSSFISPSLTIFYLDKLYKLTDVTILYNPGLLNDKLMIAKYKLETLPWLIRGVGGGDDVND